LPQATGVQKARRHEAAGSLAPGLAERYGYGDLVLAPTMEARAALARGDLMGAIGA
jgi:hypothetical protein